MIVNEMLTGRFRHVPNWRGHLVLEVEVDKQVQDLNSSHDPILRGWVKATPQHLADLQLGADEQI